jgi:hypothetical protein
MAALIVVKNWCILLLVTEIMAVKMQQLILKTGAATWWVTEPYCLLGSIFKIKISATICGRI